MYSARRTFVIYVHVAAKEPQDWPRTYGTFTRLSLFHPRLTRRTSPHLGMVAIAKSPPIREHRRAPPMWARQYPSPGWILVHSNSGRSKFTCYSCPWFGVIQAPHRSQRVTIRIKHEHASKAPRVKIPKATNEKLPRERGLRLNLSCEREQSDGRIRVKWGNRNQLLNKFICSQL